MHFEHLVQINDDSNPFLEPLTRQQLWRGLVRRAEQPDAFQPGIEAVNLLARGEGWLEREVQFGNFTVRDRIRFEVEEAVHYDTAASGQHGGGTLTMRIEEPEPGALFVRFSYTTSLPERQGGESTADDSYYTDYVKSAYHSADLETVRRIRELAADGMLDDHPPLRH